MITIKPYLRTYKSNSTTGVVWVHFYVNRQRVNFTTGVSCQVVNWQEDEFRIRAAEKNARDKNIIVENIISRVNNVIVKYRLKDRKLTREAFLRAYSRPNDYDTFYQYVREWQRKFDYKSEEGTIRVHKSVIDKLERYAPELHFDDITREWLDEYYANMRKKLGNNENTAYKNMSTIRKYVRLAYKAGYMEENPFDDWSIKRIRSSYAYLTEAELNLFIKHYISGDCDSEHYKTLEFFLFMCFSSLHIGDAKKLTLDQFLPDSFTYFRIKNRNSKPDPINVPISGPLRKIISNIVGYRTKGRIFEELPADQTMNRYLKDIATTLGVKKNLSHKAARHTFATYFLSKTKDLASLKEILGHSELRETLIYAHVLDESKQEGIKFFDKFDL